MRYSLFLDDDAGKPDMEAFRNPPVGEEGWLIAHSSAEAIVIVLAHGIPEYISFDHDLGTLSTGEPDTSMKFLHYLFDMYPDAILEIKGWNVHSKNPEGAKNIESFMDSWKRSRILP